MVLTFGNQEIMFCYLFIEYQYGTVLHIYDNNFQEAVRGKRRACMLHLSIDMPLTNIS